MSILNHPHWTEQLKLQLANLTDEGLLALAKAVAEEHECREQLANAGAIVNVLTNNVLVNPVAPKNWKW